MAEVASDSHLHPLLQEITFGGGADLQITPLTAIKWQSRKSDILLLMYPKSAVYLKEAHYCQKWQRRSSNNKEI